MPRQTQWNDGAPETTWYAPNETKEFYQYWDSDQRVADGKARKAEWDAMDPNKARSIRRARRKARKQGNVPGLPAGMGRPRTVRNRNEQPRQQPRQEPISYFDAPTQAGGAGGGLNQYGDPNDICRAPAAVELPVCKSVIKTEESLIVALTSKATGNMRQTGKPFTIRILSTAASVSIILKVTKMATTQRLEMLLKAGIPSKIQIDTQVVEERNSNVWLAKE